MEGGGGLKHKHHIGGLTAEWVGGSETQRSQVDQQLNWGVQNTKIAKVDQQLNQGV